jgi:predicted dehydrogenase
MSTSLETASLTKRRIPSTTPRLGFLGVGWIGRHRMEAIAGAGAGEIVGVCDPSAEMRSAALTTAPGAREADGLEALLDLGLDGIVIATPSALHAEQAITALERGVAVFCQKPLGRTAAETRAVVEAARAADRLLGLDLSYRFTAAMEAVRETIAAGAIGEVFAADLVFHNAYGPDKPWFYDPSLAGGGCVMDLGIHLVDLGLWTLGFPRVVEVQSRLFTGGRALPPDGSVVEDFATARLDLETGASLQLACSWKLAAGADAVISATFYGSGGAVQMHNVNGSFYDFTAERFDGTARHRLVNPPDEWGGRAAVEWATRLANGARHDPGTERLVEVSAVLDRIYGR